MSLRLPSLKSFLKFIRKIMRVSSEFWYALEENLAHTKDVALGRVYAFIRRQQVNNGILNALEKVQAVSGIKFNEPAKKRKSKRHLKAIAFPLPGKNQVIGYIALVWKDAKKEFPALKAAFENVEWFIRSDHSYQFKATVSAVLVFLMVFSPVLPSIDPLKLRGALSSQASVKTWDGGGGDNYWSTAANWSDDTVPSPDDIATFDATSDHDVVIDVDVSVSGIDIRKEYPSTLEARTGKRITVGLEGFRQDGGTFVGSTAPMDVLGSLTLLGGKFTATSGTLNIKRNLVIVAGEYEHNNGTVVLNGISQGISGSVTLNNFSKIAQVGQTLTIQSGSTVTVAGTLSLKGGAPVVEGEGTENLLTVSSSTPGEPAMIDPRGAADLEYLVLEDILNIATQTPKCEAFCYQKGGTSGWSGFEDMNQAAVLPGPAPIEFDQTTTTFLKNAVELPLINVDLAKTQKLHLQIVKGRITKAKRSKPTMD